MTLVQGRMTGPANAIYAGGHEEKSEGAADGTNAVKPGMVLISAAADGAVTPATALARSIIGIAAENTKQGIESYLTAFTATDTAVPYYCRNDLLFYGIIKNSSAALVHGDLLQTAASGELEKFAPDTTSATTVAGSIGTSVARYMGVVDLTPGATGVNRYLCERVI